MKYKKLIITAIIGINFLLIYLFYPVIELNNYNAILNEKYNYDITLTNRFKTINPTYEITNNIDIAKVGNQLLKIKVNYLGLKIKKQFNIQVKDIEKPMLNLIGNELVKVCPNKQYIEEGYNAIDNYDGNITNKVVVTNQNNNILYSIVDSSGNKNTKTRTIIYEDKEKPNIILKGNSTITLYLGTNYIEPGYNVSDNCDTDLNSKVVITNNINKNQPGTYKVKYQVTDNSNNSTELERTIIIKPRNIVNGQGKIYLTFDDGPSILTKQILDILNQEEVKATFFVVNVNEYTKVAFNTGHSIGLHSNTHNYSYIYKSKQNYFQDLESINNKVFNIIGIRSKIIRFPGGSSNTISRHYNKGIMSELVNDVINRGYSYFDWNIDSNDAGRDINNRTNIYNNVINNLSHNKTNIVLMHDSLGHDATVAALRDIIHYGKRNGYTFSALTIDTPAIRHQTNN